MFLSKVKLLLHSQYVLIDSLVLFQCNYNNTKPAGCGPLCLEQQLYKQDPLFPLLSSGPTHLRTLSAPLSTSCLARASGAGRPEWPDCPPPGTSGPAGPMWTFEWRGGLCSAAWCCSGPKSEASGGYGRCQGTSAGLHSWETKETKYTHTSNIVHASN